MNTSNIIYSSFCLPVYRLAPPQNYINYLPVQAQTLHTPAFFHRSTHGELFEGRFPSQLLSNTFNMCAVLSPNVLNGIQRQWYKGSN